MSSLTWFCSGFNVASGAGLHSFSSSCSFLWPAFVLPCLSPARADSSSRAHLLLCAAFELRLLPGSGERKPAKWEHNMSVKQKEKKRKPNLYCCPWIWLPPPPPPPPTPFILANVGKSLSLTATRREERQRDREEVAILDVLADGGIRVSTEEPVPKIIIKAWPSLLFFSRRAWG